MELLHGLKKLQQRDKSCVELISSWKDDDSS